MAELNEKKDSQFLKYLEDMRPKVDEIIETYIPRKASEEWMTFAFGKPRYRFNKEAATTGLLEPFWELMDRGGKKWRPILFLLIAEAVGGDIEKIKDAILLPEVIHNGTLIIDDIEDQGELRRGKPCIHKIFGIDVAVNAGNFMYFYPLLALVKNKEKFSSEVLVRAYEVYAQEMMNLALGQGTDIFWHNGKAINIEEDEYLQMCAFKTGCLSRMSARLAVILSEGSDEIAEAAGRVAEAMGIAFQIQDDILDIVASDEGRTDFGKAFGNDIKEGKRTLMVIHTLKNASEEDKKRLIEILDKHTDDVEERREAIEIIKKYKSLDYAKKRAQEIMADAWGEADKLLPESEAKKRLEEFVNFLITRKV